MMVALQVRLGPGLRRVKGRRVHRFFKTLVWILPVLVPVLLEAAQPKAPRVASGTTENVSCYQGRYPRQTFRPHKAQSQILVSPDGRYRAYVTVDAIVDPPEHGICHNETRLFLAKGPGPVEMIFPSTEPEKRHGWVLMWDEKRDWLEGMRLVDWSKDSSLLLTETVSWTYDSDSGYYYNSLIYEISTGMFQYPPVHSAFESFFRRKCEFQVRTEGFDNDNDLILKVAPAVPDPNEGAAQVSCVNKSKLFLYDVKNNSIRELPSNYKIRHFGNMIGPAEHTQVPGAHPLR